MALWQGTSQRKATGGRLVRSRGKRRNEMGRDVTPTHLGELRRKVIRTRGGHKHARLLQADIANVTDPSSGATKRMQITTVTENPANPHYVRRNFITKGAIIQTEGGLARVTSRPGQDGVINAVLVG